MGARYIDYLIADRFLIPEDQVSHYSEQIVWLPICYQPNDDGRDLKPDEKHRGHHGLPDDGFVFCAFNNSCKLNPLCFDAWMRLLDSVPNSVLWLLATSSLVAENLRREAAVRGVDARRLVFAKRVPYDDYMARYTHADLFLDTSPFNAGATAGDALSMGVPVLTVAGESFAARMAGSVLSSLGFAELVTFSWADYESTACDLATNPTRLRTLRDKLAQRRTSHPFFDTDRYRRYLESAYRTMWERHAAGMPPAAFAVSADVPR